MSTNLTDYRNQKVQVIFPDEVELDEQIKNLDNRIKRLTPIEIQHKADLERRKLELMLSKIMVVETIPPETLQMRNEKGEPVFAAFKVYSQSPLFTLMMRFTSWDWGLFAFDTGANHRFEIGPTDLPEVIARQYSDMETYLRKMIPVSGLLKKAQGSDVIMSTRHVGLIPDEAYEKIQAVAPLFDNQIFLIAEVDKWDYEISKPRPIRAVDPLVVGCAFNTLYLITWFDPTTPEQVLLDSAKSGS